MLALQFHSQAALRQHGASAALRQHGAARPRGEPAGPSSYREKVRGGRALFAKLARRQCSKAVWVGYRFFWFSNFGILKILLGQAAQNDVPRVRWR
jgi:hypothetical protein